MSTPATQNPNNTPAPIEAPAITPSVSFANKVERQFIAEAGSPTLWTPLQRTLAQHLYLKIDSSLKTLNEKRQPNDLITWKNINMVRLALDAVHRVNLELDALIPNHIHIIPYKDKHNPGLYTLDLRIGYAGFEHCHLKFAEDPSVAVRTELVYETDNFKEYLDENGIVRYVFDVAYPFDSTKRGKVVGGFGYFSFANPRKNKVVLVDQRDFTRSMAAAQTQDFWAENKHQEEMKRKTVIFRVYSQLALDPVKVNDSSWKAIESSRDDALEAEIAQDAALNANGETLSLGESLDKTKKRLQTMRDDSVITMMTEDPAGQSEIVDEAGF